MLCCDVAQRAAPWRPASAMHWLQNVTLSRQVTGHKCEPLSRATIRGRHQGKHWLGGAGVAPPPTPGDSCGARLCPQRCA